MKRLKMLGAVALALLCAFAQPAGYVMADSGSTATEPVRIQPKDGLTGGVISMPYYGSFVTRVLQTTTASLIVPSGVAGVLDFICAFGGTAGKYSSALDSYIPGLLGADSLSQGIITPPVFTTTLNTDTPAGLCPAGCWCPPNPIRWTNGLVGAANSGAHSTLYYWHKTTGANP